MWYENNSIFSNDLMTTKVIFVKVNKFYELLVISFVLDVKENGRNAEKFFAECVAA